MAALAALIVVILLAYSNHFDNSFHFDDSHTVVENPYIRSLQNIPRFFTDVVTFSVVPANRTYRPMVSASLAVDYWLGGGLEPFYFHVSTMFWFVLQLLVTFALFLKLSGNRWIAIFAAGLYVLHPAIAETVNYVIQRGDIYSTFGVIGGLALYAWRPEWRRFGFYLIPVAAALLSKPPAVVFPALLFVYIRLFEPDRLSTVVLRCVPALAATATMAALTLVMTPATYTPGASSAYSYRLTQPLVALRYFVSFFAPTRLSADTDLLPASSLFDHSVWLGFAFIAGIVALAWWTSARANWRPTAFGLWWFVIALIPTAIFPLAEVENDHRMYFPFVGLSLAVCWPAGLWLLRKGSRPRAWAAAVTVACMLVLCTAAWSTRLRNEAWKTEESLWYDVTLKSSANGRGLMNYGLTQMAKGDYERARTYFQRALVYTPNYPVLYINLGIVEGALQHDVEAEGYFAKVLELAPDEAEGYFFYGRWLSERRRWPEAVSKLRSAIAKNPDRLDAWYLLMNIQQSLANWQAVAADASALLQRFPGDETATRFLAQATTQPPPASPTTAEDFLDVSLQLHQAGNFLGCIEAAQSALKLRPDYAEAYNNISAAYAAMKKWDAAIEAARQAIRLWPDFQLARNNLDWAESQKNLTRILNPRQVRWSPQPPGRFLPLRSGTPWKSYWEGRQEELVRGFDRAGRGHGAGLPR